MVGDRWVIEVVVLGSWVCVLRWWTDGGKVSWGYSFFYNRMTLGIQPTAFQV